MKRIGGAEGCYGYPAALLLFSIADCVGSFVEGGKIENHFNILKNPDYYCLELEPEDIKSIFDLYRSCLVHHAVIGPVIYMDIGFPDHPVIGIVGDKQRCLYLKPFLGISKKVVERFLKISAESIDESKVAEAIRKKRWKDFESSLGAVCNATKALTGANPISNLVTGTIQTTTLGKKDQDEE
jgi:hypothetical protein